jgi:hypothetical protein
MNRGVSATGICYLREHDRAVRSSYIGRVKALFAGLGEVGQESAAFALQEGP